MSEAPAWPGVLSHDEMASLTGYRQMAAQMRWLHRQFGITPPRRGDGSPVLSHSQLEFLLHAKCGMAPPNNVLNQGWEPSWSGPPEDLKGRDRRVR